MRGVSCLRICGVWRSSSCYYRPQKHRYNLGSGDRTLFGFSGEIFAQANQVGGKPTMKLLSDDDLNLKDMTPEELDRAWDLWFDLAQETNDFDPPYTHGVLAGLGRVQAEMQSLPGGEPGRKEEAD